MKHIRVVVEIPAGTSKVVVYDPKHDFFRVVKEGEKDKTIPYLPCPGNYGFIPSTRTDDGNAEPLDVMILAEHVPTRTIVEVKPLGVLHLNKQGKPDDKIIAIPVDEENRLLSCDDFVSLQQNYPEVLGILSNWFSRAFPEEEILGWGDEKEAIKEIEERLIH